MYAKWANAENATYNVVKGNGSIVVSNVIIKTNQANEWNGLATELPFEAPTDPGSSSTTSLTFTYANEQLTGVSLGGQNP